MNQQTIDAAVRQLAETPMRLRNLFERMDPAKIRLRSNPTLFSPLEDAWHLHDIEREGYLIRIRRILTEESPVLENLDGDRLAIERRYINLELAAAINGFAAARAASLALLRGLPMQDWMRRAEFENRLIDLGTLVGMMVEHDQGHLLGIQGVFATSVAA